MADVVDFTGLKHPRDDPKRCRDTDTDTDTDCTVQAREVQCAGRQKSILCCRIDRVPIYCINIVTREVGAVLCWRISSHVQYRRKGVEVTTLFHAGLNAQEVSLY